MKDTKILAIDYDGTLKQDGTVSKRNIKAISEFRQSGNILVLDTGRNYYDAIAAINECGITFDYICPLNGNMLCDGETYKIIVEIHSFMDDFTGITETIIRMNPRFLRRYYLTEGIFLKLGNEKYEKESEWFTGCAIEKFNDSSLPFSLMTCQFESPPAAEKAADGLCKIYKNGLICAHENSVDILSKNGGKAYGLKQLANKLGIANDNIYAIGDAANDLQMISEFNGYFVDTAPEKLIKHSKGTYADVASLIEDLLL